MLTLEGLCVSSALRTEFHGLCQCQTCEVQFFSWDSSVIVDSRDTGERAAEELGSLETEGPGLGSEGTGRVGSWGKHSFNFEKT